MQYYGDRNNFYGPREAALFAVFALNYILALHNKAFLRQVVPLNCQSRLRSLKSVKTGASVY